jgi:WD40 repeat protein
VTFTPLAPTPIALVNTALPEPGEAISPENASKVGALARWGEGSIHAAAFSPDGQILALASSLGVYLYDLPTLQLDHFFPTAEAIGAVSFSADGALLAAGAQDGGVSILEAASGKHLHQLAPQGLPVADLAFLKDERQITVLYQDHFQDLTQTAVWQFADEVKSSGESYEQTGIKAAISPRSQFFTFGTLHYIEIHPIGSIKDFQLFTTLDTLDNFALADDGRTLALAKNDRIQLWDAQEDRQIWEARVTANPSSRDSLPATCEGIWVDRGYSIVNQMAFSPDGKTLAVVIYGGVVQILNGKDGSLIQQFDTDVERMIFSPDSQWLAVLPGNGTLELHNSKDGSLASRLSGHANNFPSIAFFPDGAALAAAASDGRIRFWSIPQSKQIASLKTAADHIAFSSDGHYLASADPNGQLNFWDMLTGNLNRTSQAHADGLWGLVFSPDGHKLYTGGFDCTIREWDGRNGALIRTILKNSPSITLWRSTMAISPDGSFLVTLDVTGNLRQYWIQENRLSDALPLPFQEIIFELAISPDGRQLAAGSDYGIFIYDLESQQVVAQSEWGGNQIAYSPDGQLIAIGDQDYIRLVDSQDGRLLATLTGPRGAISSLAFSPKSNYLAAGSQDGTIRVWGVIQ